MKTIITTFWQSTFINGESFITPSALKTKRIKFLIDLFYFYVLFVSIRTFSPFGQLPAWDTILTSKHLFKPIWSMQWVSMEHWDFSIRFILIFFLIAAILGLLLWKRFRIIRASVFLSFFLYLSLISSFGKIDHYLHIALLASFLFIFIPKSSTTNTADTELPKLFFGMQTLILLTYFTSGFFKLFGILDQEIRGLNSALSADSLAQNLSKTSFASNYEYFLQSFILNTSSSLFSVVLIIGFLIEFFAIYVIFKPKLHRTWGILLVLLHTGILLSVGPDFTDQIFIVGVFILFSPFSNLETDLLQDFTSYLKSLKRKDRTKTFTVFYDGECLMCNGFLKFISKYKLPNELQICKLQSQHFTNLLQQKPQLAEVDSIIVVETRTDGKETVRIKAGGIVWVLAKINRRFLPLKWCFLLSPFLGNAIYDIVAKNRKKTAPDACPIPPENIRNVLLPDE